MPAPKLTPDCHVLWHLARGVLLRLPLKHTVADLGVNQRTLYHWRRRKGLPLGPQGAKSR